MSTVTGMCDRFLQILDDALGDIDAILAQYMNCMNTPNSAATILHYQLTYIAGKYIDEYEICSHGELQESQVLKTWR